MSADYIMHFIPGLHFTHGRFNQTLRLYMFYTKAYCYEMSTSIYFNFLDFFGLIKKVIKKMLNINLRK